MKKYFSLINEFYQAIPLCWEAAKTEIQKIKVLVIQEEPLMIKSIFQASEALCRAVTYLLILIIGLTVAGLGAYIVLFLALRIGQFLWILIFQEAWL